MPNLVVFNYCLAVFYHASCAPQSNAFEIVKRKYLHPALNELGESIGAWVDARPQWCDQDLEKKLHVSESRRNSSWDILRVDIPCGHRGYLVTTGDIP